jgi:amino acid adenylation domain-containing protein
VETSTRPRAADSLPDVPLTREDIEQTVPARFEQVVRRFPQSTALTGGGRQWTYQELDGRTNAIAHAIRRRAVAGSGCVAYLCDHSPEMVIATLAILKAGKTYLAIYPAAPAARQAEIVRDVGPDLILATRALATRARELAGAACPVLVIDEVQPESVASGPQLEVQPQHPSTLFYTSGTTGQPKGVVKSHRAVLHRVWLAVEHDGIGPGDRQSLLTHCSFSASESDMFGALLTGATLCVFDFATLGLTAFREWLEAERITLLHPPVLLFRRFLATLSGENLFPSVRLVALAGDVVLPADLQAWKRHFAPSCVLMHRFSITETGLLCLARIEAGSLNGAESIPAGRPVADKSLELVDEAGRPVPIGEPGELIVRSRYIAEGYWRPPAESAVGTGFEPDPDTPGQRIYRTGDRGRFLPGGGFVFEGRRDRQAKIRGFRVELREIEAALGRHPKVREAAVVVRDRPPNDKQLVAFVVPSADAPTPVELRAFLRETLPPYMIPARLVLLESLPLTATGKVDRQALPEVDRGGEQGAIYAEPRSELERQLAGLWEELLVIDRVGIGDNFFDLGGHSLLAAQMFARLEERLRVRLPLATLFQAPTIEQLAAVIERGKSSTSWRSLVAIQPGGTRPPIFGLRGAGGNVVGYHDLSALLGPDQPFYGLQSRGLNGTDEPLTDLSEIAEACLAEIREVQPRGPYHLVGACMGAVAAYEIAQRLHAAGETVAFLGLIEPRPPTRKAQRPGPVPVRALTVFRFIRGRLGLYRRTFAGLSGRQRLAYVRERLAMVGEIIVRRDLFRGNRTELNLAVVRQANLRAVHAYAPKEYPGRITLFLAEGRTPASGEDPRLGWNQLARGGTEVYYVPGDDSGLALVRPNVEVLAPIIQACLSREQAKQPVAVPEPKPEVDVAWSFALTDPVRPIETVADAFVDLLAAQSVEHVFVNPGSDIAPILESLAKFAALGRPAPRVTLCLHESVALAAAHGYFMVTGRPQVVLVHADVGTQNLGANLHNAQRGRAGVVICAGSVAGCVPGGRDRHMDWIQDQFDQASIVDGYVKWRYRVTSPEALPAAVDRAFQLASAAPEGPVYLTLPKDVLLKKVAELPAEPARSPRTAPAAADPASLARAAEWLVAAERPLILVAYAGRNPAAVASLTRLAETLAAPVVESRHRLNFPSSHPLHLGFSALPHAARADCILILDHDVPWVPTQGRPSPDCRIIHVDIDPLKRDMPIWGLPVDLALQADSALAAAALATEIERRLTPTDRARIEARRREAGGEHDALRAGWRQRAAGLATRHPIAPEWAAHCLDQIVDRDTVVIAEAVSNNPMLWHHLELDSPGTYYQSLGSGLGWGLGAAVGAKLAQPGKTVVCVVGDGSWVFGSPIAAYSAAEQHQAPFLTVVFNNHGYAATVESIRAVAPDGFARRTNSYPACDLPKGPRCSKVAEAMGLWARTVEDPAELPVALREAIGQVRQGRSALVDISISSHRSAERISDE